MNARSVSPREVIHMSKLLAIDHVQLAIPAEGEDAARRYFVGVLGLTEVPKPAQLAARGGCWFRDGSVFVHCGIASDFVPATKAHIAFLVSDVRGLALHLQSIGQKVTWDTAVPEELRFYSTDPFGNRLEFMDISTHPSISDVAV